jgi:nitrate reductase NapAB chaperone NapD
MKNYKITLKHDKGKINLIVKASNEEEAINKILNAENCPKSAIIKINII